MLSVCQRGGLVAAFSTLSTIRTLSCNARLRPMTLATKAMRGGGGVSPTASVLLRAAAVNGDNDKDNQDDSDNAQPSQSTRQGRTGWTHSVPDASSDFWVPYGSGGDASEGSASSVESGQKPNSNSPKFRTGWLHNQQSSQQQQPQPSQSSSSSTTTTNVARQRLQQAMVEAERNHRILSPVAFHSHSAASSPQQLVAVTEHAISVPLRYNDDNDSDTKNAKNKDTLDVYFTVVERVDASSSSGKSETYRWMQRELSNDVSPTRRAQAYVRKSQLANADGMCLYLQGGPGFGAPTPVSGLSVESATSSWAAQALHGGLFERVVLMDQRGTGRSSPVTKQTLQRNFPNLFALDKKNVKPDANDDENTSLDALAATHPEETEQVREAVREVTDYLTCFRADNIVRDAERVREALLAPPNLDDNANDKDDTNKEDNPSSPTTTPKPWGGCLGQSYGGFCLLTYLSQMEHPPQLCFFTGGLAPICTNLTDVYTDLWKRVQRRNLRYYEQYPGDVRVVKRLVQRLLDSPAPLPSGGLLTARRFLQLGLNYLGGSPGTSFAALHALLQSAVVDADAANAEDLEFSRAFLQTVDASQSFDHHPIYYWMHESIYANGNKNNNNNESDENGLVSNLPTAWAAHRAFQALSETAPDLWDYRHTSLHMDDNSAPTLFFGEMVFPWMSRDYEELSGVGLTLVANSLADKTDWGPLWDATAMQQALRSGRSRAAAAVYYDDLYVDFGGSTRLVKEGGPMEGCKIYVTNEYQHSGLRDDGATLFAKLYGMATGATRVPS